VPGTPGTDVDKADVVATTLAGSADPSAADTRDTQADVPAVPAAPEVTAPRPAERVENVEKKVGVMLTSHPPGAIVLVGGAEKGGTPVTLSFDVTASSELVIVLRKDRFEDRIVVLPVGPELAGQTLVVHHELERRRGARPPVHDPFKDL
jgi:hypothetical protein